MDAILDKLGNVYPPGARERIRFDVGNLLFSIQSLVPELGVFVTNGGIELPRLVLSNTMPIVHKGV
jgi:hypothetical protein